ncbi:MAG: hypothetical protein ACTSVM_02490 [Candidatus Ranarchaeia archaeon]
MAVEVLLDEIREKLDALSNSQNADSIIELVESYIREKDVKLNRLQFQLQAKQKEIDRLRQENIKYRKQLELDKKNSLTSEKSPDISELQNKNRKLLDMLKAREEELNRLYNLTETDLKYRCYYIVRDEAPNWVSFSDIYRFVNLPSSEVQRHLKAFAMRGLVEIKGNKVRAKHVIRRTF